MDKYLKSIFIFLLVSCLALFAGCETKESHSNNIQESTKQENSVPIEELSTSQPQVSQSQDIDTPEQNEAVVFSHEPNSFLGTYITADPNIQAGPEVLDSITMTLPEGITRQRVSDRQFDFVRDGTQVGGFLLVDIPEDMLKKAAETKDDFLTLSDHLGKQIMEDVYPSELTVVGGGKIKNSEFYLAVFFKSNEKDGIWAQYLHRIYIGEEYCYDFWLDEAWWPDAGLGIQDSLSSSDIKPELNKADFAWSFGS